MKFFTKNIMIQAIIFLSLIMQNSCKKDSTDFGKYDNYTPSPEFAIPLFNTKISMLNLIESDSIYTKVDPTGLVQFIFRQDSIFSYKVTDFFAFDNQNATTINNTMGEITINDVSNTKATKLQELTANFSTTAKNTFDAIAGSTTIFPAITENLSNMTTFSAFTEFSSIRFSQGWLIITITNKLPINLNAITLNLYNLSPSQTLLGVFNFSNISPGATKSDSISLINKTLSNSLGYTMPVFNTNSSAPTAVTINYQDSIIITAQTKNLKAVSGVAKLPNQSIVNNSTNLDFTPSDTTQRIRKLKLATGRVNIIAQSTINEPIEITINFTGALKNGSPYPSQVITIPKTGSSSFYIDSTINLAGVDLDLTQLPSKPYNNVPITYSARVISSGNPVAFNSTDFVNLQVLTSSTTIDNIEGYFGQIEIPTKNNDFINLSFLNSIKGGFKLDAPELIFTVNNSIGVPIQFQYNFKGKNNSGDEQDAEMKPFDANYPLLAEIGQTKNKVQVYSNANNNGKINELMSLPPHSIQILGKLVTNPIPDPTKNQFIKQGNNLNVNMEIKLPLALHTDNFTLEDSNAFDANQFEPFRELTLSLSIENGFPFESKMKIIFLNDEKNIAVDSITYDQIILSAITDANGKTIQSTKSKTKIAMNEARLQKLIAGKVNKIKTISTLKTENNGTKPVKVYSDYEMKISLGIIASLKK